MALFLAHTTLLLLLSGLTARRLVRPQVDRILAAVALAWANIVVTSLLLGSLAALGEPAWFFRASLILAAGMWVAARFIRPPAPAESGVEEDIIDPRLLTAFVLTLLPLAWMSMRIAATYPPNNYDTLTYHLPRAMYYLGQGHLGHFDTGNPRQTYFPFNYNLLQLFALIYRPPLVTLNFINLSAWAVSGLAVFRLTRLAGCHANFALLAAWFALTATQILAQGSATTNDLPTGAGLLVTLIFGLRWRSSGARRDALLAGIAAGLTVGSKLTVIFFAPAAGLIGLLLFWQHWRRREQSVFFAGLWRWIPAALAAAVLAAPFALINLAAKGEWINKTYDFTLNRPFSFACVVQTAEAYLVQIFLEPLHRFTFDLKVTAELNAWGQKTFFPDWNPAHAFSDLYLFPPDLNEDHVFFGFTGPVLLLGAAYCLVRFRRMPAAVVWAAVMGLGWFATYFLLNKWSLYNQRYFVPAMLVLAPAFGAAAEQLWQHDRWRGWLRRALSLFAILALWLAGIYLFQNTSRPYGPLWSDRPAPPAWPALPSVMTERLAGEKRINIQSTDGNERVFLLMAQGQGQKFTSVHRTLPDAYNVFSEWGFVRKVAYSNIEQLSSYAVVEIPGKRTAGVEFLGTVGTGQPARDYYGLAAHAERQPATHANRNLLVEFHYAPRDPNRYLYLHIKVAGLNAPDNVRLTVGVDYADGSSEKLADFTATGEAKSSAPRPIKRFTLRAYDRTTGELVGFSDLPYLPRDLPPDIDTPHDPMLLLSDQFISAFTTTRTKGEGLGPLDGPYPQWDLPNFRWAKSPVVRLELPEIPALGAIDLSFELRLHVRDHAFIDVVHNGELVKSYSWEGHTRWLIQKLRLKSKPGVNVIEFRNVAVSDRPDWTDYLERYPDVKDYLLGRNIPLEQGAREHWENFGRKENRILHNQRQVVRVPGEEQLYFLFRDLRIEGFRAQ